jgi:hypothetical protein
MLRGSLLERDGMLLGSMHFPVYIHFFGLKVHPHAGASARSF